MIRNTDYAEPNDLVGLLIYWAEIGSSSCGELAHGVFTARLTR